MRRLLLVRDEQAPRVHRLLLVKLIQHDRWRRRRRQAFEIHLHECRLRLATRLPAHRMRDVRILDINLPKQPQWQLQTPNGRGREVIRLVVEDRIVINVDDLLRRLLGRRVRREHALVAFPSWRLGGFQRLLPQRLEGVLPAYAVQPASGHACFGRLVARKLLLQGNGEGGARLVAQFLALVVHAHPRRLGQVLLVYLIHVIVLADL